MEKGAGGPARRGSAGAAARPLRSAQAATSLHGCSKGFRAGKVPSESRFLLPQSACVMYLDIWSLASPLLPPAKRPKITGRDPLIREIAISHMRYYSDESQSGIQKRCQALSSRKMCSPLPKLLTASPEQLQNL